MERTISLLYHDVVDRGGYASSGFQGADADRYKLTTSEFDAHLDAIARRVTPKPGLFTFDDGGASAVRIGALLAARRWSGYFFITTDVIGTPGFVTAAHIRALAASGHQVGSHTCSHPARMAALTRAQLLKEWTNSRKALEDILGVPVRVASIPGGYYSATVAETAADAGYTQLFSSEPVARPWRVGPLSVYGRYSVQQGSSSELVAAIADGAVVPRASQFAYWNAKKLLKRAGGTHWLRFRKAVLSARETVRPLDGQS